MHDVCGEVYYKPSGYETKPYIGILVEKEGIEYAIPLSSAKEKHKSWKNVEMDRFLIFEHCTCQKLGAKAMYIENPDGSVKHILTVIDVKKMIPIKKGVYSTVNLNSSETASPNDKKYKVLLNIEYSFCLKIMDSLIKKASKVYEKQIKTGRIPRFCCDFKLLERVCDEFPLEWQ